MICLPPRRHLRLPTLVALVVACLAVPVTAQKTWIVDAAGGPGHHFKNLPPAVAAAADGDTILVRPGTYMFSQLVIAKGLTILGAPGVRVRGNPFSAQETLHVKGLSAGKTVVLEGLRIETNGTALWIESCQGRVHVESVQIPLDCTRLPPLGSLLCNTGIRVTDCTQVTIANCDVQGRNPLDVARSTVVVSRSKAKGFDGRTVLLKWIVTLVQGTPALVAYHAVVIVDRSSFTGGNGASANIQGSWVVAPSEPAIRATGGELTVAGDALDVHAAGVRDARQPKPTSAIVLDGTKLWLDPKVKLASNAGAPPISGSHLRRSGRPVSLVAAGAPPGGTARVTTISPAGEKVWLLLGLPAPIATTPYGELWIDPGSMALVASTTQNATEHWSVAVPVPNIPQLRGWVVMFQALSGLGTRGAPFRLSSPGAAILN